MNESTTLLDKELCYPNETFNENNIQKQNQEINGNMDKLFSKEEKEVYRSVMKICNFLLNNEHVLDAKNEELKTKVTKLKEIFRTAIKTKNVKLFKKLVRGATFYLFNLLRNHKELNNVVLAEESLKDDVIKYTRYIFMVSFKRFDDELKLTI